MHTLHLHALIINVLPENYFPPKNEEYNSAEGDMHLLMDQRLPN